MKLIEARIFALSTVLVAAGAIALFAGCKGNPTSAATGRDKPVGPPPAITILPAGTDPTNLDPLSAAEWVSTPWYTLTAPSNTARSTPPVRAAMLYDADHLYVAFVSDKVPPPPAPISRDAVSVYLDTTAAGNGCEVEKISVTREGKVSCDWIRIAMPAQAKDDGSPDWQHPYSENPNYAVPGLVAKTSRGMQNGSEVWTAVIAIPLRSLPLPLRQVATVGTVWKLNLLRSILTEDMGSGREQWQANLSPVFVGAQAISPYRMATITLAGPVAKR